MMLKLSLTLLLAACGANPTPSPSSRRTEAPHDFAAELRAATKGPADDDAVCTYAVFSPGAPSRNADRDGLARVNLALRREGLPDVSLALTVVPVDAELPLSLPLLIDEAQGHAAALQAASQVTFLRYRGPALKDEGQLRALLVAAAGTAEHSSGVVTDLSTLSTRSAGELLTAAKQDREGLFQSEARLVVEAAGDGSLTFRTRGHAKFGRPDLEHTGVRPEAAKTLGPEFQRRVEVLRNGPFIKPGEAFEGAPALPCAGIKETYDHLCVAY